MTKKMNKQIPDLPYENFPKKEHKVKWVIIEDVSNKVMHFIDKILDFFPEDLIIWLHTSEENIHDEASRTANQKIVEKVVSDNRITYQWFEDQEAFSHYCSKEIFAGNSVLLLDIRAPLFEYKVMPDEIPVLRNAARLFLEAEGNKLLILSTGAANVNNWTQAISKEDDRILAFGSIYYDRDGEVKGDCVTTVVKANEEWVRKYGNVNRLGAYFDRVKKLTVGECHWNFHRWKIKEDLPRLWHESYDLPMQLGCLIDLLQYDKDRFVQDFELYKEHNGKLRLVEHHILLECLKYFGPAGSSGISLLATILIAWSAYRQIFFGKEGDRMFRDCIYSINESDIPWIAKSSSVVAPQSQKALEQSAKALHHVFSCLFKSQYRWRDNLKSISVDKHRLLFNLVNVDYEALAEKLRKEYKQRYFEGQIKRNSRLASRRGPAKQKQGGRDTSKSILRFLEYSTYSDQDVEDNMLIFGAQHPLKIKTTRHGIQLIFGDD